jgi:hypothetical protein
MTKRSRVGGPRLKNNSSLMVSTFNLLFGPSIQKLKFVMNLDSMLSIWMTKVGDMDITSL